MIGLMINRTGKIYKINSKLVLALAIALISFSCIRREPLNDAQVSRSDFELKKESFEKFFPDYFSKLDDKNLDDETKNYLEYLFTYMPISDFADYDFEFWQRHVEFSIMAKSTFNWADSIPEDIFKHYVLPPRVNNENLDTARMVFFRDLKTRFEGMDLTTEQAVLEINHWCNERVIYRGTDERTIGPLSIVRSGFGRCGEESTFLVTALRSAGIPARQVYTPRWAHSDDNHAWVEVWIDGLWYHLGACEPAPVLNTGWFDIPATRTMLVHTKRFGNENDKSVLTKTKNYEWVNALAKYAPVKTIKVRVLDENNLPVWGAKVNYQIYNYAEMYPLYSDITDFYGYSDFTTGYGSLEVFVTDGVKCTSRIIKPEEEGWVNIVFGNKNVLPAESAHYIPPIAGEVVKPDEELVKETEDRIKQNERIRKQREKDFYNEFSGKHFAETFGYEENIIPYLIQCRGNWPEIEKFLIEASFMSNQDMAIVLLSELSEKDLRDSKSEILSEHLTFALKYKNSDIPEDIFYEYVLNPRVEFEMLKTYRKKIVNSLGQDKVEELKNNPSKILEYIKSLVVSDLEYGGNTYDANEFNMYNVPITPSAVCEYGLADIRSLKIYFVAFCRSIGVPAKIDFASGFSQYYHLGEWYDVAIDETQEEPERGKVFFVSKDSLRDLKYRINFAIARYDNGEFKTVDLGWETPISSMNKGVNVPIGEYMLLSSLRLEDGSVLVNRQYFELAGNEIIYLNVELPEENNLETQYETFNHSNVSDIYGNILNSKSIFGSNNYLVLIWLKPSAEPSKHILRDLKSLYGELANNKIKVVYLTENNFVSDEIQGLAETYIDRELSLLYRNVNCKTGGAGVSFPQIIMINKSGDVLFKSAGYIINSGDMFLQKAK